MIKYALLTVLFSFSAFSFSQTNSPNVRLKDSIEVRSVFGFSPSRAKTINGLKLKYWYNENHELNTNGLELNLNVISVFMPFLTLIHAPLLLKNGPEENSLGGIKFDKINGVRLSLGSLDPAIINGVELNLTGGFDTKINGLSITPLINKHVKTNGIGIALLGNSDTKVNGIQIGLFNNTLNLRGIQLGLWNKNEKRSLPFINWNFKH